MKKILTTVLVLFYTICVCGQIYIKNSEQRFIEKIVSKGLVLLKSDYVIEDNKTQQQFGLNGKKTFSSVYSIGYLTEKGIVTDADMCSLVLNDVKFDKYKDKYNPIIISSVWNFYKDSTYNELKTDSLSAANNEKIFIYNYGNKENKNKEGFSLLSNGENGWIVWVCIDEDSSLNSSSELVFYSYQYTNKNVKSESIPCPQYHEKVLGGVILSPNYSNVGKVIFSLTGILRKVDKEWFVESTICNAKQSGCSNEDTSLELTPIASPKKNNKKRKK